MSKKDIDFSSINHNNSTNERYSNERFIFHCIYISGIEMLFDNFAGRSAKY